MLISTQSVSSKLSSRPEAQQTNSSANFRFWLTSDVSAHAPLSDEAILGLFRCYMEESCSFLSGVSASEDKMTVGFLVIVPFTWTVKEQYVLMCFDAFVVWCLCSLSKCLCRFLPTSESNFQFAVFVSSSSLFFLFHIIPCFVGDVHLLDSCALSPECTLYVIWVQFYFKKGGCLCAAAACRPKMTVY